MMAESLNNSKPKKATKDDEVAKKQVELEKNKKKEVDSSSKVKDLENKVKELEKKNEESYNKYLRVLAESENRRKRFEKDKHDFLKFSQEESLKELLPLLDSLNEALQVDSKEVTAIRDGVGLVRKKLLDILEKKGVEAIETSDCPFDPTVHQAIQKEESEEIDTPTIKKEFVKGYLLNGRLLRPAIVSVVIPKGKN